MDQRSEQWHNLRLGRFTGSRISELMGVRGLGKTGENYCFENACEIVFGRDEDEQFVSYDMQRGINLEPFAFKKIQELKELEFKEVTECSFYVYGDNAGASPDGLIDKDGCLEIKCPRPKKFFNLMYNGENAIDKNYIWQMQMEMMVTNSDYCCFFNYIIYNAEPLWFEIEVKRDDEKIELIKERIKLAVDLRNEMADNLRKKLNERKHQLRNPKG